MLDPRARRRFLEHRAAVAGGVVVVALVAFAVLGPLLAGADPNHSDFDYGHRDGVPLWTSPRHLLGTDHLFRDELSRLAHGARISLLIGFVATLLSIVVGALVGLASGYTEGSRYGVVDGALMRLVDIGLSFPYLLLVMAIGAAVGQTSVLTILLILGFTSWFSTARVVRSKTLQLRTLDFVAASRALGEQPANVLLRHILPNVLGPLIVIGSSSVAQMIIAESVLSYLQVGLSPPQATWGRMLQEGQAYLNLAPHLVIAPGLMIFLAVIGFNLVGEGLRDALDPHEN